MLDSDLDLQVEGSRPADRLPTVERALEEVVRVEHVVDEELGADVGGAGVERIPYGDLLDVARRNLERGVHAEEPGAVARGAGLVRTVRLAPGVVRHRGIRGQRGRRARAVDACRADVAMADRPDDVRRRRYALVVVEVERGIRLGQLEEAARDRAVGIAVGDGEVEIA